MMPRPSRFKSVKHKAGSQGRNRKGTPSVKKELTLWDQASRWYDSLVGSQGTDFQKDIIMPGVFRLLEIGKKDRVLDLACGQGVFSRFMAKKGIQVEGLDSSSELLKYARERSGPSIKYHVGDAGNPEVLKEDVFDGIACLMAIQNIERMDLVFKSVNKWLKAGKCFVMVTIHPCFRIPRQSHWGWDDEKKLEYRRVDHYLTETTVPILTPPFADPDSFTLTYHRPIQSYISALAQAGFYVDAMEEWISNKNSLPGKRSKAENRARKEIPLFMALRARLVAEHSK
jgi:ubiquinone/menaquinone biosynthesis C-methylase UbiE